jgi:hypothetical protein
LNALLIITRARAHNSRPVARPASDSAENSATAAEQPDGLFDNDYATLMASLGNEDTTLGNETTALNDAAAAPNQQAAAQNVTIGMQAANEALQGRGDAADSPAWPVDTGLVCCPPA